MLHMCMCVSQSVLYSLHWYMFTFTASKSCSEAVVLVCISTKFICFLNQKIFNVVNSLFCMIHGPNVVSVSVLQCNKLMTQVTSHALSVQCKHPENSARKICQN